jgi:hypothetical protein
MPSNQELKSLWFGPSGVLGSAGESELFYPGELGKTQWFADPNNSDAPIQLQKVFRLAADSGTPAAGNLVYWQDRDNYVVSADVTDAIGAETNPFIAGTWLGTGPNAGYYGIIQIGGPVAEFNLAGSGTNAAGDALVSGATDLATSGLVKAQAADTTDQLLHVVARATASGDTTTGPSGDLVLVVNN